MTSVFVGYRPLQAAHDLVFLARAADRDVVRRLAAGVPSADMSAEDALVALDDLIGGSGCRIVSDAALAVHETVLLAAALPDEDFDAFLLATVILLADRILKGRGPDDLYWHWDAFSDHYRLASPQMRAALINGFVEVQRLGLLPAGSVEISPVSGVDLGRVRADLRTIAASASDAVLESIAAADYGDRTTAHLAALRAVIGDQGCVLKPDQAWVPSEVIELTAHDPAKPGFLVATAILLVTALALGDEQGWFDFRWPQHAPVYDRFPPRARWAVLSAIRYLYESDPWFDPYAQATFDPVEHRAHLIPLLSVADRPSG